MVETHLQWHPDSDPDNRCVVVSGRLTAFLRTRWGVLKEREKGDLHHALDAAVVAAASRSLVKRLADHARRKEVETLRDCVDPETGEVLDEKALQQAEERFPDPWPHFRRELLGRLSANPAAILEGVPGYEGEEYPLPIRVSRPPQRRGTGEAHKGTIRSRIDERESSAKTPLEDLKLKDLDNIVGGDRDKKLVEAIRERLERYDGDGKKAFGKGTEPLRKPSRDPARAPIIRSVKLRNPSQNSGIPVRQGIADNGGMLRVDIFRKGKKFYGVPVYVHHATQKELPDRAVVSGKVEADWERMDENGEFLFSLHPGDWVRLTLKKEVREGYYGGFDRANAAINIWTHDRNRNVGKDGLIRGNGFQTAIAIEKFHVDMLGKLYPASKERRRPLRRAGNGM
jgi:CRISPR-associated endonuclease Csn1